MFIKYFEEIIAIFIIIIVSIALSFLLRHLINRYIERKSRDINVDPTNYLFIKNAISFIIFIGATVIIFVSIPPLKSVGLSLFAGAGILAAAIGFASQQAFANIISGIFIVVSKPLRVGDFIKIDSEKSGLVEDITLRHTIIRNFENRRIIVPNSTIGNATIINSSITDEKICKHIEMGISYDSNIDLAIKIMQDEIEKHSYNIDNRTEEDIALDQPRVIVRLIGFGDSSVNLRAYAWAIGPVEAWQMQCDVYKSIKKSFDEKGIEIPFPYRTIVYKNDTSTKN